MNEQSIVTFIWKTYYTLIEQTKSIPQELLDFKLKKQMEAFSILPAINFSEEGKWYLAVTSPEATNSVFNKTHENNSFSILAPRFWTPEGGEEHLTKLNELF